jgi:predicted esterase
MIRLSLLALALFGCLSAAGSALADDALPAGGAPLTSRAPEARSPDMKQRTKLPEVAKDAIKRAKQFKIAIRRPREPSGETLILLHGSGGNETTLMPLAEKIAPHAVLVGIAGRITQDGTKRWYERITPTSFVQSDIRAEAQALADFLADQVKKGEIDLAHTTFLGYSNGANLLAAFSLLHPGLIQRAALLRPMPVLEEAPATDLAKARFLTVIGEADTTYAPFGPTLTEMLRSCGANVQTKLIKSGHDLGDEDVKAVSDWLAAAHTVSMNQ